MTTERIVHFLWRHFGSHERPAALHALVCRDSVIAPNGTELDLDLDDDDVSLEALVAEVWTGRNEKMGNMGDDCWVDVFDRCRTPVGDGGERAAVPSLPLTVYRVGHPAGMSWTMSTEVVQHFLRMRPSDAVWQCVVTESEDVLAIFRDRNEEEVVLHPRGSWRTKVERAVSHACHGGVAEG